MLLYLLDDDRGEEIIIDVNVEGLGTKLNREHFARKSV